MTAHVGAYQAKTHLSQLLERVAQGEKIIITRHGSPIAVLQPVAADQQMPVTDAISALKALRQQHRLSGLSVRELIEEGRQ